MKNPTTTIVGRDVRRKFQSKRHPISLVKPRWEVVVLFNPDPHASNARAGLASALK